MDVATKCVLRCWEVNVFGSATPLDAGAEQQAWVTLSIYVHVIVLFLASIPSTRSMLMHLELHHSSCLTIVVAAAASLLLAVTTM